MRVCRSFLIPTLLALFGGSTLVFADLPAIHLLTSPVSLVRQRWNFALDVGLSEHWMLGPKGVEYSGSNTVLNSTTGRDYGLRLAYFPDGTHFQSGFLFRLSAGYASREAKNDFSDVFTNASVGSVVLSDAHVSFRERVRGPIFLEA